MHTLLVVDDDLEVLEVLRRALTAPGFVVLTASDPFEATALLAERVVDVLITDVRMPGMTGFELARQAKLMQYRLHVIYLSGYYATADDRGRPTYGTLLKKPLRATDLIAELHRELEDRGC